MSNFSPGSAGANTIEGVELSRQACLYLSSVPTCAVTGLPDARWTWYFSISSVERDQLLLTLRFDAAMPEYQLAVAVTLTTVLAGSLSTFVFSSWNKPKDALPTFTDGQEGLVRDPFDVTKPEDFVDGTPLNEDLFWTKVCREIGRAHV